uniref:Uncharacterized protein n=1 Tax=Wuchereria bancrofti TaxID=6293 RepID=A0AAF5PSE1_WUCBA
MNGTKEEIHLTFQVEKEKTSVNIPFNFIF